MASNGNPDTLPPDVQAALQRGSIIEAIRLLRDATGLGLKESKEAVDRYVASHPLPSARNAATPQAVRTEAMSAARLLRSVVEETLRKPAGDVPPSLQAAMDSKLAPGEVAQGSWLGTVGWIVGAAICGAILYHQFGN